MLRAIFLSIVVVVSCFGCGDSAARDSARVLAFVLRDFVFVERQLLDQPFVPGHTPSEQAAGREHFLSGYRYVFHRLQSLDEAALVDTVLPKRLMELGVSVDGFETFTVFVGGPLFEVEFKVQDNIVTFFSVVDGIIMQSDDLSARWSPHDYVLELRPVQLN
jgi:hypothetical protein